MIIHPADLAPDTGAVTTVADDTIEYFGLTFAVPPPVEPKHWALTFQKHALGTLAFGYTLIVFLLMKKGVTLGYETGGAYYLRTSQALLLFGGIPVLLAVFYLTGKILKTQSVTDAHRRSALAVATTTAVSVPVSSFVIAYPAWVCPLWAAIVTALLFASIAIVSLLPMTRKTVAAMALGATTATFLVGWSGYIKVDATETERGNARAIVALQKDISAAQAWGTKIYTLQGSGAAGYPQILDSRTAVSTARYGAYDVYVVTMKNGEMARCKGNCVALGHHVTLDLDEGRVLIPRGRTVDVEIRIADHETHSIRQLKRAAAGMVDNLERADLSYTAEDLMAALHPSGA